MQWPLLVLWSGSFRPLVAYHALAICSGLYPLLDVVDCGECATTDLHSTQPVLHFCPTPQRITAWDYSHDSSKGVADRDILCLIHQLESALIDYDLPWLLVRRSLVRVPATEPGVRGLVHARDVSSTQVVCCTSRMITHFAFCVNVLH